MNNYKIIHKSNTCNIIIILLILLTYSNIGYSDSYKCIANGKTYYQDHPTESCQPIHLIEESAVVQPHSAIKHNSADPSSLYKSPKPERSQAAKDAFKYNHPCPATGNNHGPCPGYVIDHVYPLACGGADAPGNMQWQTEQAGKAKDAWERKSCQPRYFTPGRVDPDSPPELVIRGDRTESGASGSTNYGGHSIQTGPRGGRFYINSNGNKTYIKH